MPPMDDTDTPARNTLEDIMDRLAKERSQWSLRRKVWMNFRWKVAQPIERFPRQVRWFIQRGRRGWSDYDMWGMDYYMARLNIEMLVELRRNAHGYPGDLTNGTNEPWLDDDDRSRLTVKNALIDTQIGFKGDPDDGFERWRAMLAYFEHGWRCQVSHMEDVGDEGHERFKEMLPLYGEYFGALWD